jgi:LuxR family maltose regulon positive regulatory protein
MLLTTKFYLPRPQPHFVLRPRLYKQLADALTAKLLLLSAPAGFGKTTLLATWINSQRSRDDGTAPPAVAWLSLDEDDNDPVRFFRYLIAALQTVDATIGAAIPILQPGVQPPPIDILLTMLINDLSTRRDSILLLLDDYHLITTSEIHEAITFLVEHLPPAITLGVSSRADPPLPLSRWRVRRQLSEIRAEDLRFSEEEIDQFLRQELAITLPSTAVAALARRTEGWIAGLQLAALSLQGHTNPTKFVDHFTGSHSYIIDYLVEEVLHRQSPATQCFLLQTSLLQRLCGPLCDAVTERTDSQALLEQVQRANLFLIPLDEQRQWYRYHHLFAEVLQQRLRQQEEALAPQLHRRAGYWYEEQGLLSDAIHHALAGGDLAHAAGLIESTAERLRKHGEFVTLNALLDRLPDDLIAAHPRLALARANGLVFQHQLAQAEEWLRRSERANGELGDAEVRGNIAAIRTDVALNRNDLAGALRLAEEALTYLPETDLYSRSFVKLLEGVAHFWSQSYAAAQASYDAAFQLAHTSGALLICIYAQAAKAEVLQRQGYLREVAAALNQIFDFARSQGIEQSPMLGSSLVIQGELCYEWNDLDGAVNYLDRGLACAKQAQNPRTQLHVYTSYLRVVTALEQPMAVKQTIADAEQLIQRFQLPAQMVNDFQVGQWRLALQAGDSAQVAAALRVRQQHHAAPFVTDVENVDLLHARLLVAQTDYAGALVLLKRVLTAVETVNLPHTLEVQALMAVAYAGMGDGAQARALTEQVLLRAEPHGFIRTLLDMGAAFHTLIAQCRWASQEPTLRETLCTYQRTLLAAVRPSVAPAAATAIDSRTPLPLVEPLSERELEVLRLVEQGLSNAAIADRLIVTVGTVKRHLNNIFGKLSVSSRTQAIAQARTLGYLH